MSVGNAHSINIVLLGGHVIGQCLCIGSALSAALDTQKTGAGCIRAYQQTRSHCSAVTKSRLPLEAASNESRMVYWISEVRLKINNHRHHGLKALVVPQSQSNMTRAKPPCAPRCRCTCFYFFTELLLKASNNSGRACKSWTA
jgi:hypothetical protein